MCASFWLLLDLARPGLTSWSLESKFQSEERHWRLTTFKDSQKGFSRQFRQTTWNWDALVSPTNANSFTCNEPSSQDLHSLWQRIPTTGLEQAKFQISQFSHHSDFLRSLLHGSRRFHVQTPPSLRGSSILSTWRWAVISGQSVSEAVKICSIFTWPFLFIIEIRFISVQTNLVQYTSQKWGSILRAPPVPERDHSCFNVTALL